MLLVWPVMSRSASSACNPGQLEAEKIDGIEGTVNKGGLTVEGSLVGNIVD